MTFSVQYLYCKSGGLLPTELTQWSATAAGPRNIQLDWITANELPGRQYVIQRSTDNSNFVDIASLSASAGGGTVDYTYPDELPGSPESSWYYRLQINDGVQQSYSPIRQVTLTKSGGQGLTVYPNPAVDFINLVPTQQDAGDWQVDILAANGNLIQRNTFIQTRAMLITFQHKLAVGTYFVRATGLAGQKAITTTFVVTGAQ